jgi:PHD/YefM family antitoxin component YafN of YafNO toxin-antitoxin module
MVTQEQRERRDQLVNYDNSIIIACDWVKMDTARRSAGSPAIVWSADFDLPGIGDDIVVSSANDFIATVIDYGIKLVGDDFHRAVWIKNNKAEVVKLAAEEFKLMTEEDRDRIEKQNAEFKKRLIGAGKKVERNRKERRQKQVQGSHLLEQMMALIQARGLVIDEKSSFYQVTGNVKGLKVYVAIKGGRVDTSGFSFEHPGLELITEEQARNRHIGKVRGTINFHVGDENAMAAYEEALSFLSS